PGVHLRRLQPGRRPRPPLSPGSHLRGSGRGGIAGPGTEVVAGDKGHFREEWLVRRRLAAIGVATAALMGPTLAAIQARAPTAQAALKPPPNPSVINHVVVMMQENRSSDHYLGQLH